MRHSGCSDRQLVGALLALSVLIPAGCTLSQFDHLTRVESVSPSASECGACHVAIYEEYTSSAHSQSWVRPRFVDATSEHYFGECLGCHAPVSLFEPGPLRVRDSNREEGVTCVTCHFDDGVMVGPASPSALVEPHPVIRDSVFFESPELCGNCHEATMAEWSAAAGDDKATCQECHMPSVTRTLTQGTGVFSDVLVSFEERYEGRQHLFHIGTEAVIHDGLDAELIDAVRGLRGVNCTVAIINNVPHFVPTGAFGIRRLDVVVEGLGRDDVVVTRTEHSVRRALGQSLRPGEHRVVFVVVGPTASALRLTVFSVDDSGEPVVVISRRWVLP